METKHRVIADTILFLNPTRGFLKISSETYLNLDN
jgi:hypothetical protein